MKIGYARVSSTGQSLEVQLEALRAAGCEETFEEKKSGKTGSKRPQLEAVLKFIRKGDCLVVTKLDRLARSTLDLHQIAQRLAEKGADLMVIGQPGMDTTTPTGKLLFTVLGAIGEFERSLILERTAEGRAKAKAAGKHLGRYPTLDAQQIAALRADAASWEGSMAELGAKYGIARSSVYRLIGDRA
jgi:DNA invertase Pin-like site-specific DNA recombinase